MTTSPDRDDVIDGLLRRMQPDAPGSAGDDCVDAERLARWADGALSGEERAALIAHTVRCARCHTLVLAMMRTAPPAPAGTARRSPWTLVRWGLPLAAAAALIVWFAVDREVAPQRASERVEQPASAASAAKVPPPPSADVEAPRSTPPPPADAAPGRAARGGRARAETREGEASRSGEARALKGAPAGTAPADTLPDAAPLARAPALTEPIAAPGPVPPAPPPSAPPPPPAQTAQPTQQIPGGGLAERVTVQSEPASPPAADQRREPQGTWVDVHSADPLVRWRFTRGGDVERSADGGVTWTREPIPGSRVRLTVGSAPSSSVCWLAGAGGVVLRFTAEQGWRRVPLPVRGDADWMDASDAQNAWVRVQGRRFRTTDGGRTWR